MVILSDSSIRAALADGRIAIDPLGHNAVQPSSVDLRLANQFLLMRTHRRALIDVKQDMTDLMEPIEVDDEPFLLHPGEFALGSTLESVTLPADLVGRLEGKSSLGRLGLLIHSTAGFVDAGWHGQLTLELSNVARLPITLYAGMKIGQISFMEMTSVADVPYGSDSVGSKYQDQRGPVASQYWKNFHDT